MQCSPPLTGWWVNTAGIKLRFSTYCYIAQWFYNFLARNMEWISTHLQWHGYRSWRMCPAEIGMRGTNANCAHRFCHFTEFQATDCLYYGKVLPKLGVMAASQISIKNYTVHYCTGWTKKVGHCVWLSISLKHLTDLRDFWYTSTLQYRSVRSIRKDDDEGGWERD